MKNKSLAKFLFPWKLVDQLNEITYYMCADITVAFELKMNE